MHWTGEKSAERQLEGKKKNSSDFLFEANYAEIEESKITEVVPKSVGCFQFTLFFPFPHLEPIARSKYPLAIGVMSIVISLSQPKARFTLC